ncbi:MAG TPA: LEA type 2 family protein [Longimicrobiales bacterium]|nr:LEA type 2 family protein [Longimicrobiales bacterium]
MTKRRLFALVWLVVAGGIWGCGRVIEEPDVRVTSVRLGGVGLEGGLLYVGLNVYNPNGFGIETSQLTYQLELAEPGSVNGDAVWNDIAGDTIDRTISIPARDSTTLEVPVRFTYRGVAGAIRSLISTGTFDYRIRGSVTLSRPVRWEFPFRQTGTVSGI